MKKMANGEPLGPPGRPGKGSYLERLQNEGKDPRKKKKKKQHMGVEGPTKKMGITLKEHVVIMVHYLICIYLLNQFRHTSYPLSLTC